MKWTNIIKPLTAVCIFAMFIVACSTVPLTGRSQLNLVSDGQVLSMSFQQYDDFMKKNRLSRKQRETAMVKRAGRRIQKAVETYFARKNMSHVLKGYAWEFNLVENNAVNAWCMPGGKVVVYEGILPVARDEDGLAVVMGHEIAHAVAKHGNERMSQGLLTQTGGMALSLFMQSQPAATQKLAMTAFGLGATYGFLMPYSRLHESEADHMGLIFMTMAKYDPNAAISFWQRMDRNAGGRRPPEFLSTHPTGQTRVEKIRAAIPGIVREYGR